MDTLMISLVATLMRALMLLPEMLPGLVCCVSCSAVSSRRPVSGTRASIENQKVFFSCPCEGKSGSSRCRGRQPRGFYWDAALVPRECSRGLLGCSRGSWCPADLVCRCGNVRRGWEAAASSVRGQARVGAHLRRCGGSRKWHKEEKKVEALTPNEP